MHILREFGWRLSELRVMCLELRVLCFVLSVMCCEFGVKSYELALPRFETLAGLLVKTSLGKV